MKKLNVIDLFAGTGGLSEGFLQTGKFNLIAHVEWEAGTSIDTIWDGIIQFRPSGIRVKRPDTFQALVAMVQIPIVGKLKRRITPREAARLQSFPDTFIPNSNDQQAYKQFGNAVNVNVVQLLAEQLFDLDKQKKNIIKKIERPSLFGEDNNEKDN